MTVLPAFVFLLEDLPHYLRSGGPEVLILAEKFEDQLMELRILEIPLQGSRVSAPTKHVPLGLEEVLPVVSHEGDEGSHAPHVSRGGGVLIISTEDLRSEIADSSSRLGFVVQGGGSLS